MIFLAIVGGLGFAGGYYGARGYKAAAASVSGSAVRSFLNGALGLDDSGDDATADSSGTNEGAP